MSAIFTRGDLWIKIPNKVQRDQFINVLSSKFTGFTGFSLKQKPGFISKQFKEEWKDWKAVSDLVAVDASGRRSPALVPEDFIRKSSVFLIVKKDFISLLDSQRWQEAADSVHSICKIRAVPFHDVATIRFSSLSYFMPDSFRWPQLGVDSVRALTSFPSVDALDGTKLWPVYQIYAGFLVDLSPELRKFILSHIDVTASVFGHRKVPGTSRAVRVGGSIGSSDPKYERTATLLTALGASKKEFAEIAVRRENTFNIIGGTPEQRKLLKIVNAISTPCDTTAWLFIHNRQLDGPKLLAL